MRDNLLTINGISYIQVQPVFLYESLWCLLLFLLLMTMRRKKKYEGELFMIYLAGYGLGRFFFEWLRTDKLYIPGTKVGISLVISAMLFAVFMPVVIVRRVMAQKRDTIRQQRKKRFLDESVKEKQMFPETSEMKPEPEIRPEMDEQVKPCLLYTSEVAEGEVISQEPEAGNWEDPDNVNVVITVSTGDQEPSAQSDSADILNSHNFP